MESKIKKIAEMIEEMEYVFSIIIDFDELEKCGIIEKKPDSQRTYSILKMDEFPKDAIKQVVETIQITNSINSDENKVYFKFPSEKERIKKLDYFRKTKKKFLEFI